MVRAAWLDGRQRVESSTGWERILAQKRKSRRLSVPPGKIDASGINFAPVSRPEFCSAASRTEAVLAAKGTSIEGFYALIAIAVRDAIIIGY
jgi:hypothetical protein